MAAPRTAQQPPPSQPGGGTAAALAATGQTAPAVPAAGALTQAVAPMAAGTAVGVAAAALASHIVWLDDMKDGNAAWVAGRVRGRGLPAQDLWELTAEENEREAEFRRVSQARVMDGIRKLQKLPDKRAQRAAARGLIEQERRYARQRSEALAVRTVRAVERAQLRVVSPGGAFWVLGKGVRRHTRDCVLMAGHFWPWSVLDIFRPPTHPGCRCKLISLLEAQRLALVLRGALQTPDEAERRLRRALAAAE